LDRLDAFSLPRPSSERQRAGDGFDVGSLIGSIAGAGVGGGILFVVIGLRRLELPRKQIPPLFQSKEFSAQYQVNPDSDST
jgi:hypothetical protein